MKRQVKRLAFGAERWLYGRGMRPFGQLQLPDFLDLGPGQAASTWLAQHLDAHPGVHVAAKKETHYFSRFLNETSLREYASYFAGADAAVRGEFSPGYSILRRDRIALIRRLMPDVKLLMVLRNPIERSWSGARRVMPRLGLSSDDDALLDYLDVEWAYRTPGVEPLAGAYQPGLLEGNYSEALDNWLAKFPAAQMLTIFFEDIREQPARTLARVCRHIGADPDFRWDEATLRSAVNPNPPVVMPENVRQFLAQKYRGEIAMLAQRFGGHARAWLEQLDAGV